MSEEILFNFKENPYPESEVIEDYKVLAEDIKSQMALWELYKFLKCELSLS